MKESQVKMGDTLREVGQHGRVTIAIIGTGYVGMASAIGFAGFGHRVVGCDILPERIEQLQQGITPYCEAGIESVLKQYLQAGQICFVKTVAEAVHEADFIAIAVGTPSLADGSADLSAVEDVVGQLGDLQIAGKVVVLRSTVPPGTSERFAIQLQARANFLYAPEFLREGSAVRDFMNPDRLVIGAENRACALSYAALFTGLNVPIFVMSTRSAELAKGMANAYLALKISFANQVANLCDAVEADAIDVLEAVGADHRIGQQFLHPGIGFGGPCFAKDIVSLTHVAKGHGVHCDLLEATLRVNKRQPLRILEILEEELGSNLAGLEFGVWGLTYKAGTDDLRASLAIDIVNHLLERKAAVRIYDPALERHYCNLPYHLVASPQEAAHADALLVLTDWPEFAAIDPHDIAWRLRRSLVLDGRNLLNPDAYIEAGVDYRGIGRQKKRIAARAQQDFLSCPPHTTDQQEGYAWSASKDFAMSIMLLESESLL